MGKFVFDLHSKTPKELGQLLLAECQKEHFEINLKQVQKILDLGADVNMTSLGGKTPLMYASLQNHLDLAKKLVTKYGAQINAQDSNGRTAYFHAMYFKNPDMVKLLLDLGADKAIKDITNNTAEEFAKKSGRYKIAHLSKTHIAKNRSPK